MASPSIDTYAASLSAPTHEKAVLILTANDVQDLEFFYPYYRFVEEGYQVDVVTPKGGEFKGKHGMGLKETKAIREVSASHYDLLYIPGGKAPEALKKNEEALALVRNFAANRKPIAAICHGPQVLAAADLIRGKSIAAWPEVEKEITQAGARYIDEPTVVDDEFITARWPGDLPAHMRETLKKLATSVPVPRTGSRRASG